MWSTACRHYCTANNIGRTGKVAHGKTMERGTWKAMEMKGIAEWREEEWIFGMTPSAKRSKEEKYTGPILDLGEVNMGEIGRRKR